MRIHKALIFISAVFIFSLSVCAQDEAAYDAYTYNRWGEAVPSPHGYLPRRQLFGADFGAGELKAPGDLFVDRENNTLYIADSGNNRIIILDENYNRKGIISTFQNSGKADGFNYPTGIFVDGSGKLYIADQNNSRIVILDSEGGFIAEHGKPKSDLITEDFDYKPSKVVVDSYNRIYIQATGVYQGMICLNLDGGFINYYGSNRVDMTAGMILTQLWKKLLTREQAKGLENLVPIEYSNIYIDRDNFVYATAAVSKTNTNQIVKLNPLGTNIFRVKYTSWYGGAIFSDISADEEGIITVIDTVKGRVLQCDEDGRLMFALGGIGDQLGTFRKPAAVEEFCGKLLVLDTDKNSITEFVLTSFGASIRKAITLYNEGRYQESIKPWQEVVKRNSNYLLAYTGLGKAYYQLEDYETAMKYFKLADNRYNYSEAYKEYSLLVMRRNFGFSVLGIFALVALFIAIRVYKKTRKKRKAQGAGAQDRRVKAS